MSYHLLWSGVGGQLLFYHICHQRFYHLPWSGVGGLLLSYHLLWSGVGGQLLFYHICHQNQISYSKTNVSREAPSKFHRTKLPKRTFPARLPRNFTEQASETSVSCEASSKFLRPSFQNERFVRGFLKISQNKLPKQTFCARLPRNFIEQASKTNVLCEASSKFHRTSFQNKRFVRGFLEISQNNLPKRAFRARLPPNFIEQSFQNERFLRGFLEISQNKLPKRAFRARLPRNFSDQASKTSVSCEASSKFHRTSFQNKRFVRGFLEIS